jgi:hypothetical protein
MTRFNAGILVASESWWVLGAVAARRIPRCRSRALAEMVSLVTTPRCPRDRCKWNPRKSNPSLRCVTLVFSIDRVRCKESVRNWQTSSRIASACALVPLQRMTKSSAYRA